tara:strand:+ start:433 stop:720 length:288 start_codon:yes stop_codon:yes gene_type:complete
MYKNRTAHRVDSNQQAIVKKLRSCGISVQTNMDDILVGYKGKNFQFEIKDPKTLKKDGNFKAGTIKPSQVELKKNWKGHYSIVTTFEQILEDIKQ